MGDVMPSAARRLARFVIGLRLDDVPSSVVTKAALLALDTLGCALAAPRSDCCRAAGRHSHPTPRAGAVGAAAVACKLHGLTEDELVHAFGICGSQAGGIIEYLADGSWTKRLHPGWAAHAGVVATLLAQSGFTGPETVFEGEHGFYRAFAGGFDE